ncbi:hypothetical protein EB118_15410, partial [bacterium]|nr:hypothetical protein [bacterium]NDG31441.1 hypothetical protein [bacterium]
LENGITVPKALTVFQFAETTQAFVSYVLVQGSDKSALFTLRGINDGGDWSLSTSYIGQPTGVRFYLIGGTVLYTNTNVSDVWTIRFRTLADIKTITGTPDPEDPIQITAPLSSGIDWQPFPITLVDTDAISLVMYVSSMDTAKYSLYFLTANQIDMTTKTLNYYQTGEHLPIQFRITNNVLEYLNTTSEDYTSITLETRVLSTQESIIVDALTIVPKNVHTTYFRFGTDIKTFRLIIYVELLLEQHKRAAYEILGFRTPQNEWKINSRYIGETTQLTFSITTVLGVGYLQVTNPNSVNAILRFNKNLPLPLPTCRICKNLSILGKLDMNGNVIENVQLPMLPTDAANKGYVDNYFTQFTAGQLIIGAENNRIRGDSQLTFTNGVLNVEAPAQFSTSVTMGGLLNMSTKRIINVATPQEFGDAANKAYVDAKFETCCDNGGSSDPLYYENSFALDNNVLVPVDIPPFQFDASVRAFVSYVYLNQTLMGKVYDSLVTIRGYTTGSEWVINKCFIGNRGNVDFVMRTTGTGKGIMQYTNSNLTGTSNIKYRVMTQITEVAGPNQTNLMLTGAQNYTYIPGLSFLSDTIDTVQIVMYVSSTTNDKHALYFLNCVLKGDTWYLHCYFVGDNTGLFFRVQTLGSVGSIEYKNMDFVNVDYVARIQSVQVLRKQNTSTLILVPASTPTVIDQVRVNKNTIRHFQLVVYVEVPANDKYAVYEIDGFLDTLNNEWKINTRFFGDITGVSFYLNADYLEYTNANTTNANIRYILNLPSSYIPLQVANGGTGNVYLEPYAVLRGNGDQPIIGTPDFIYQDYKLILGELSGIVLNNTSPALNLTTGTFVCGGGITVKKNIIIGESMIVKDVDFTPSVGDIFSERYFYAANNVQVPQDVDNFVFNHSSVKSFSSTICVTLTTTDDEYDTLYDVKGIKKRSGWVINKTYIGDNIGIDFYIGVTGQIRYTSPDTPQWISTVMKFRALTTTL